VAAFLVVVVAVQLQVRLVEEPYLRRLHGETYADYAQRVGRFFPGVGRLVRG
jgi:protein-S-isoprenylcysteine O-methyltransferase Ste14